MSRPADWWALGHSLVREEGEGVELHMWMRFFFRSVGVK